jgi:predicted DNA binding CopG/RHH family protein
MNPLDHEEQEILEAFEAGTLRSVATAAERSRLEASARSTATKDQRINIRLTSEDLAPCVPVPCRRAFPPRP